jgi:hypothetical protein
MLYNLGFWPEGRVAVALIMNQQTMNMKEPPLLFVSQWGGSIDKVKEAVKKLVSKNTEIGGRSKPAEDYRGVSLETMIDEDNVEFCYCFVEDCLIGSFAGIEPLKFVVAHIKGADSPALSGQSDISSAIVATGPDRDIVLYVNLKHIIKTACEEDKGGEAKQFFTNMGLDNVVSFCFSMGVARQPANTSSLKALLKIEGDKKGICRLLDCTSSSLKIPRFVPASTYSITALNLNMKNAFDELLKIVGSFSPQAAAVFYTPLLPSSPDGQPGIELKRDIIENLGSQIIITKQIPRPITDAEPVPEGLFAVSTTNSRALEKALSELHSKFIAQGNEQSKRELLGHTVYLIAISSFLPGVTISKASTQDAASEGRAGQSGNIAFTFTDSYLIAGLQSPVEQAIRTLEGSASDSLVSVKWFNAARDALPSVAGLSYLSDEVTELEIMWRSLKSAAKAVGSAGKGSDSTIGLNVGGQLGLGPSVSLPNNGPFDPALLPEFDSMKKYIGSTVLSGVSRTDGFFFELKEVPAQQE